MILAIDPGETVGLAMLFEDWILAGKFSASTDERPYEGFAVFFRNFLDFQVQARRDRVRVVVENYRIFADKAALHIGQRLITAELIGAIEALCATTVPEVLVARIEPNKKGLWPDARLRAKLPSDMIPTDQHAKDALKIGLVYLEMCYAWKP